MSKIKVIDPEMAKNEGYLKTGFTLGATAMATLMGAKDSDIDQKTIDALYDTVIDLYAKKLKSEEDKKKC